MHPVSKKLKYAANAVNFTGDFIYKFVNNGPFIILYHSVYNKKETDYIIDNWAISKKEFEKHLKIFKKYFIPVSVSFLVHKIKNGKKLNPKWMAVTFDDGFKNVINNAVPILEKYQIPWTFCIPSLCIENKIIPWQTQLSIIDFIAKDNKIKKLIKFELENTHNHKLDKSGFNVSILKDIIIKRYNGFGIYEFINSINLLLPIKELKKINKNYEMSTWNDLIELKNNSKLVEFAIHGGFHFFLNKDLINIELVKSKKIFDKNISECNTFSVVGGLLSERLISQLEKAKYKVCLTSGISNEINFNSKIIKVPRIVGEYTKNQLLFNLLKNKNNLKQNNLNHPNNIPK